MVTVGPGKSFVTSGNQQLQKWDADTGELLATKPIGRSFESVSTAKGGARAAFANRGIIALVDLKTLTLERKLDLFKVRNWSEREGIKDVAFLDDGKLLVGACSKDRAQILRVVDLQGKLVSNFEIPAECAGPLAVSGDRIAVVSDESVRVLSLATKEVLVAIHGKAGSIVRGVAFSPSGAQLAFGVDRSGGDDEVTVVDVASGVVVQTFGPFDFGRDGPLSDLQFSEDGTAVAVASAYSVRIFDAATGLERARFEPKLGGSANALVLGSLATLDGKLAVPLRGPDVLARLDWKTATQFAPKDLGRHDHPIAWSGFGTDGAIVTSADSTIRTWDAAGVPRATFEAQTSSPIVVTKQGVLLSLGRPAAGGSCTLREHDATTLAPRWERPWDADAQAFPCDSETFRLSRDETVAYVRAGRRLFAFDRTKNEPLTAITLTGKGRPIASDDGFAALSDGTIATFEGDHWDVRDGRTLALLRRIELKHKRVTASPTALVGVVDPDRYATKSVEKLVIVSLSDGRELHLVAPPDDMRFTEAVAFSPDGTKLYVGVRDDKRSGVTAIGVETGTILGTLGDLHQSQQAAATSLTVNVDGTRLIEGNADQTALVLDTNVLLASRRP